MKLKIDSINASVNSDRFDAKIDGVGASYNDKTKTIAWEYREYELQFDTYKN